MAAITTPQKLSDALQATVLAEFGPDQPAERFPTLFFNWDVKTIAPDETETPRAPKNCATNYGASAMAAVWFNAQVPGLQLTGMELGNAVNFSGLRGGWSDSELVPYLKFMEAAGQVAYVNAGLLLDYFNHGYPAEKAMSAAIAEAQAASFA